ncbi:UNVERIFIED_CONTAM: Copia protein [Sesamum radiatum]|uniref:Copia protein n=1 Tax=Sesamum radiatum TaxID=300843 RepID=A0AAW2PHC8_SESRA
MAGTSVGSRREPDLPDFLHLHGGDHPGMVLVSASFDETDFLAWRRSIVIALRAKMKLGFIDGTYTVLEKSLDTYEAWIRVDSMVTSWILNAITERISKAFLYAKSSRQLWLDLEERYKESNGPLVYQLQRAISSARQGTQNVVEYFNSLTALWDEIECLMPPKTCTCGLCTCGFTRITAEEDNLIKLVQFLMGLYDSYDPIRNQILLLEPFPSVNKAHSMVLRVERQRLVNMQTAENSESIALHTKWNNRRTFGQRRDGQQPTFFDKGNFGGKGTVDKRSQTCSNCGRMVHTKDTCFKLFGVPDWYKTLKDQKRKEGAPSKGFNVTSTEGIHTGDPASDFGEAMKQGDDFAGTGFLTDFGSWIVDTGATNHMCADPSLLVNHHSPLHNSSVHLPDDSSQPAQKTKEIIGVGKVKGGLYIIDKESFDPVHIAQESVTLHSPHCNMSSLDTSWLWHKRLVHPSFLVLSVIIFSNPWVEAIHEPKSFIEASRFEHWREAMAKEIEALEKNCTWELAELPPGKKAIGSRWVYKVKLKQDGTIERYKARLVAKGYTQIEGVDYFDSDSPVAKTVTVRLFIAIATANQWLIL